MKIKKFFKKLSKFYRKENYPVKFYCQESTFSYEIYSKDNAFTGDPLVVSAIYDFWNSSKDMKQIIKHIKIDRKRLTMVTSMKINEIS